MISFVGKLIDENRIENRDIIIEWLAKNGPNIEFEFNVRLNDTLFE